MTNSEEKKHNSYKKWKNKRKKFTKIIQNKISRRRSETYLIKKTLKKQQLPDNMI